MNSSPPATATDHDVLDIQEDSSEVANGDPAGQPWRILVVDDEPEVHAATLYALQGLKVLGHCLEFIQAYSAAEAHRVLLETQNIAVILLDVVMESDDAGLRLVRTIRDELCNADVRIILRTGQPGYAPELEVIRDYDINDYKTKSELTRTRLLTSIITAIRAYDQICSVRESQRGMGRIVQAAPRLLAQRDIESFSRVALEQLTSLLEEPEADAIFCVRHGIAGEPGQESGWHVVSASGRMAIHLEKDVDSIDDRSLQEALRSCQSTGTCNQDSTTLSLCLGHGENSALVHLRCSRSIGAHERQMIQILTLNIGIGLENIALLRHMNHLAFFDQLCQLPNRIRFMDIIQQHLDREDRSWTVAIVDIDHFSDINASFGHQTGDSLLRAVARRLRLGMLAEVELARISGDTFGLFGPDPSIDPDHIHSLFDQPLVVDGQSLIIQPYIGLVRLSEADQIGADVIKNASIALNKAKSERSAHWKFFTRDMQGATLARLGLLNGLRHAAETKRGLSVCYQPQVDIGTGEIKGAEALMRWRNADGEDVSPSRFIPVAEYSQLIIELGEWVLHSACEALRVWQRAGFHELRMSVNVSPAQLRDPNFFGMARRCIHGAGLDASRIEFEITENIALSDSESTAVQVLHKLRNLGVSIAVDDFGTGFSSLGYLKNLPLNRLKIDRTFVANLGMKGTDSSIAEMIIRLGHILDLSVIAEGVETREQLDILRQLGCQEIQGFYISPGISGENFLKLLLSGKPAPGGGRPAGLDFS